VCCLTLPFRAFGHTATPPGATTDAAIPAAQSRQHHAATNPGGSAERQDRHLAPLRAQLRITAAQQPQWQEFSKASRGIAAELRPRFAQRRSHLASISAADTMADFAQIAQPHPQELGRLAQAIRTPCASLTPQQQKAAATHWRVAPGEAGGGLGRRGSAGAKQSRALSRRQTCRRGRQRG